MDELERIFGRESAGGGTDKKRNEKSRQKREEYDVRGSSIDDTYKYTKDGHRIYTPEELRLGEGRDGEECPFECNCCF
jgi:Eukaryotic protein of unknown function (DUF1764)